jgi:hypothetical protein
MLLLMLVTVDIEPGLTAQQDECKNQKEAKVI